MQTAFCCKHCRLQPLIRSAQGFKRTMLEGLPFDHGKTFISAPTYGTWPRLRTLKCGKCTKGPVLEQEPQQRDPSYAEFNESLCTYNQLLANFPQNKPSPHVRARRNSIEGSLTKEDNMSTVKKQLWILPKFGQRPLRT